MTERLAADQEGIGRAVEILRAGGLVAFPTDTVYGIGCRWTDAEALARLFSAKRRPIDRQVPVLIGGLAQATAAGYRADARAGSLAAKFWPGAVTIVLAASRPDAASVAFRVPDHPVALELIGHAGPLWTSSANRSGEPETTEADEVLVAFADTQLLDAVLDGGRAPGGLASTVIDLTATPARLLREGPIGRRALTEVVGPVD